MNVTGLPASVPDDAVTVLLPAVGPNVSVLDATPELFVVVAVEVSAPPPAVTAKVTVTPETPLPLASLTFTVNGALNCCPTVPVWLFPLTRAIVDAAAVPVAVALKVTGLPVRVPDDAVTVLVPAFGPRVSVLEASPELFVVVAVAVRVPPPAVTAKVTVTPETALPLASLTLTVKGALNCCPTEPDWLFPLTRESAEAGSVPPPPLPLGAMAFTLN
jgi:hypothetical protein